ncbi:MAG: DUF4838 domain-containing protein [Kiritimatiellia bacterium]
MKLTAENMFCLLAAFISLVVVRTSPADVELAKDGQPMADIVVETNAISSVQLAANDLQEFIEKMSGARLEITNAPSDKFKFHVYVGPSEFTQKLGVTTEDFKPEEFRIIARDNYVILIGCDEQRKPFPYKHFGEGLTNWWKFAGEKYGVPVAEPFTGKLGFFPFDATATLYASSELLEQLGVRWYFPYEDGTVVPKKKSVSVPEQNTVKAPVFPVRQSSFYWTMDSDAEGVLWFKRLKYGSSYAYHVSHGTATMISFPEQKKEHPEYFAQVNGKRLGSLGGGVPRLCDEGFRRSSLNFLNKTFEACPGLIGFNLMPTDGFTQIDERDAIIWSRPERGYVNQFSDYVWDYWLWAAKELKKIHPDKYLICVSYAPYDGPPLGVDKLPDNIAMQLGQNTATLFMNKKTVYERRAKWLSLLSSGKMFMYDYYLFYREENFPRYPAFFTKLLQEDMQALRGVCEGKNIEVAPGPNKKDKKGGWRLRCPGLTHMLHYWQGKLYWDPDMDRLKMLDEYYELYFGPAKAEMKEFYEFAEEVWMRPESRSVTATSGFMKQKDVDRYFDILKRARSKAGKDSAYDRRILQIEEEMQPLRIQFANLRRTGPTFQGYITKIPPQIDGDLTKPYWQSEKWWERYTMKDPVTGQEPDKNRTRVSFTMTPDGSNLVVGIICDESRMDKIVAKAKNNDDPDILNDDAVEIYLETPEHSYFKIVVNSEGKIYDESQDVSIVERDTLPLLWNPGIKAAVCRDKYRWMAEILIPTKDFGTLGPDQAYPWGINVGRTRRAGGEPEIFTIAPTGQAQLCVLSRLGNLRAQ